MLSFYVRGEDGEEYGPVDLEEIREWSLDNRVGLGTMVRADEPAAKWKPWQDVPELAAVLAEVHNGAVFLSQPKLRLAPVSFRLLASIIDFSIVLAVTYFLVYTLLLLVPPGEQQQEVTTALKGFFDYTTVRPAHGLWLLVGLCAVGYFTYFHSALGQTPGKGIFHLRVVDHEGQKPTRRTAFLRALGFVTLGVLSPLALFTPRRQALHDLLVDTCVVKSES